jgi:hypothetical protein
MSAKKCRSVRKKLNTKGIGDSKCGIGQGGSKIVRALPITDGLAPARFGISNDSLFVTFLVAALVSHSISPAFAGLIISGG